MWITTIVGNMQTYLGLQISLGSDTASITGLVKELVAG